MNGIHMTQCFNEWMRRYIEEPEKFEADFRTVNEFLKDDADGREPSYGESCATYMEKIAADLLLST